MLFPGRYARISLALLGVVILAALLRHRSRATAIRFGKPIAALLAAVAVSLVVTPDIDLSLPKVCGLLLGIGIFVVAQWAPNSDDIVDCLVTALVIGGTIIALVGLWATSWWTIGKLLPADFAGISPSSSSPGAQPVPLVHPNEIGGALALVFPVTMAVAMSHRRVNSSWMARLAIASLLVQSVALILTQSRSALAALIVALGIWFSLRHIRRVRCWVLNSLQNAPSWLLLTGILMIGLSPTFLLSNAVASSIDVLTGGATDSGYSRVSIWQQSWAVASDVPLTGLGLNVFRRVVVENYDWPDVDLPHAHNQLLQVLLDLGPLGLIGYCAILAGAGKSLAARSMTAPLDWLAQGSGAGILAQYLFGLFDAIALGAKPSIFLWIAFALVVLPRPARASNTSIAEPRVHHSPRAIAAHADPA